jgi:hypothetical protein
LLTSSFLFAHVRSPAESRRAGAVSFRGEQAAAQFLGIVWQDILRFWCQNDRIVVVLADPENVERVQALMEATVIGEEFKQAWRTPTS